MDYLWLTIGIAAILALANWIGHSVAEALG